MKKFLRIGATTCLVGFGVWFGLFITTTLHGLLGEANPSLYLAFSRLSIAAGVIASALWAWRRICGKRVRIPEWALLLFASLSLSYLSYLLISNEVNEFWAFDPLVAAQRFEKWNNTPGDTFTFLGTTSMGVRIYSVAREGKSTSVIGVAPRFGLWWSYAYGAASLKDYEDYESRGILDRPQK